MNLFQRSGFVVFGELEKFTFTKIPNYGMKFPSMANNLSFIFHKPSVILPDFHSGTVNLKVTECCPFF